ncbi:protein kinase, partial [Acidobacteriota bacterium]
MGTVAYMSPEQARGEEVDHRTDIWSLGAMLYEILAGERPFIKDHEQALIFSILNDEPKSVSSLRSEVPSYLESIIQKALEKDVIKRFQSIQEFIQDLQKPQKTTLPRAEKSIAVLPFDDMSPEKNQEYFCDGIAEEIINALTQLKDLRVIARTSSFVFKGKHVDVREIGNKLDVGTLLEGSVRKAGNRLRITAQLINVADGSHIWSERYDREMEDVFAIQDEISLAIVDKLKMKLVGQEKAAISKQPTDDLEAYNLYLKGRFFKNKFTDDGLTKAIDLFEKAVKKDPNFALANAELAETYFWHATGFGVYSQKDYLPRAKDAALRAVELDPYLAESHTSLAWVATWYDWDRTRAERGFRRAIELNPNYAPAHFYYALYLALLEQKFDEAFIELNKAIDIDPFNMLFPTVEGYIYYSAGHEYSIDLLIEKTQMVLSLDPHYAAAHHMLADAYLFTSINEGKDLYDKAIEEYKEAIRLGGRCTNHLGELAVAYAASGQTGKAKEILKELEKRVELNQCESFWVAFIYSQMGQLDKAFECLERAYEEHESSLIWVIQLQIDIIRNDPRFSVLLNKMGLGHLAPKKEIEVVNISADISTQKYEKSIVVLPFDDVSPGKDNEYFSDGMTEEIISDLSKIHSMRVISRTSSMMLKGTRKSMKTIGLELDVQYVLEGSVRKAGNNLRITAQLIDATGDAHLWAEKYGGTLDDVFDIQEKVSRSIVDVLKVKLSPEEDRKIADRPIEDIHVHECYLRARQKILECTEKSLEESLGFLQEGLNVYGENAELYAGLALTYFYFVDTGIRYDEA